MHAALTTKEVFIAIVRLDLLVLHVQVKLIKTLIFIKNYFVNSEYFLLLHF